MCPIETPEGPNIGLIGSLASYARVNEFGFIETPYRKVEAGKVTTKVEYLTAIEEERFIIAQANAPLKEDGGFQNPRVLVRRAGGGEVEYVPPKDVDYMDVSPNRSFRSRPHSSRSSSTTPNRARWVLHVQRQAVPLLTADAPLVGTGVEQRAAQDSGDMIVSPIVGEVVEVTGDEIIKEKETNKKHTFVLDKFAAPTRARA